MVSKNFKLHLQQPVKGDWVSTCKKDLKELKIEPARYQGNKNDGQR